MSAPSPTPIAGTPLTGSGILPTVQSYGAYIYWGLGIIASLGIGYVLYKMNFQIAGVLIFLGAILALFYYYVKWFQLPSSSSPVWPPVTTACPDFLSNINTGSTTTAHCLDYVGVSANGKLQKADPTKNYYPSNPADAKYIFTVDRTKGPTDLCQSAADYGLTWSTICPE